MNQFYLILNVFLLCSASKWAAVGFTESLAEEMRRKGADIGFSTVCPTFVNTNLVHGVQDRAVMRNK